MIHLDVRLVPHTGAQVLAALEPRQERIYAEARRQGRRESAQAYAADALVALVQDAESGSESSGARGPQAMVHVLADHEVLASGRLERGQRCEIPGMGPIPASVAGALAADAVLKAVVTTKDGDIHQVVHLGRTIPARVRTALEVRDPVCVVPGCDVRKGLEIDHWRIPYAHDAPTRLDNLARLCGWHHYQKTHLGYRLSGGPGDWIWQTPDDLTGPEENAQPPPVAERA
jgi:hypothetical protein